MRVANPATTGYVYFGTLYKAKGADRESEGPNNQKTEREEAESLS